MWFPGIELEVSSLVAGRLTCWAISGSLVDLLSLILEQLVEEKRKATYSTWYLNEMLNAI